MARAVWRVPVFLVFCAGSAFAQWSDASTPDLADLTPSHGATWADFDNDGDLDLYVANNGNNKLFRNDGEDGGSPGDWLFVNVAPTGTGIGSSQVSSVGIWGDYDNDGDLDLYLANTQGANHLFRNDPVTPGWPEDPDRLFVDVTNSLVLGSTRSTHTCSWIDYDRDGDLDLYMTDSVGNILLRNDGESPYSPGEWLFTDVTVMTATGSTGDSQSAVWADYDDDGDQDLFIVDYNGTNLLLRNDPENPGDPDDLRRVFVDMTVAAGLDGTGLGRGAAWGDFDNDGDFDLYVTNYAQANRLYRNDAGVFMDISANALVDDAGNGRNCSWIDYDNDGDLDLHVVNFDNGVVTEDSRLYRNDGPDGGEPDGWLFVEVADVLLANDEADGASSCWADYDGDGDLDVYLANWNNGHANRLVRNDQATGNHFLHVNLIGKSSGVTAIGARLTLSAGGVHQIREINGGEGYHSQNTLTAEFGLGTATLVDSLLIEWPTGGIQQILTLAADQWLQFSEVGPDVPTMYVEPLYTAGTVNTVSWSDEAASGAVEYEVQAAESTEFADLVGTSGWIAGLSHEFTGLTDGQLVYYRVRSRNAQSITSRWSDSVASTQDDGVPFSNVLPVDTPREALPFYVTFTADDNGSGVDFVELWYNFDGGPWLLVDTVCDEGPFLFNVPDGVGLYGFYTVATDFLGVAEAAPAIADITVVTVPSEWVNVAPTDGSGVGNDGNGRGAAWGDYDGDGAPDLFITNRPVWFTGADETNHLYHNDGEDLGNPDSWLFQDTTTGAMSDADYGQGVAWGDFDGDGDLDFYEASMTVSSPSPNHLFRNDGGGAFTDIAPQTGTDDTGSSRSVAWVDFDNDGDLDLYLSSDGPNRLYRNDGEDPWEPGAWLFTNVAPENGTGIGDDRYTMGCAWGDFDNDGDQDLYLANYNGGANALFRNDGGDPYNEGEWLWTNVATVMGVDDADDGLGCTWGDYDGDGWLDLYLTNQGPNRLYHRIAGSDLFENVAPLIGNGLDDGSYSTGCAWADYDNDQDLDLYVASHWTNAQDDWVPNMLFRNDGENLGGPGGWNFVNVASKMGFGVGSGANTTAACWADYDEDGDLDVYLCNMTGTANELFRNDVPETAYNRWLHIDLVSKSYNTTAIGARVRCSAAGQRMIREVDGGSGFVSQSSLTVEFGLGLIAVADTVEILWPSGIVQTLFDVAANQRLTIEEPGPDAPVITALPLFSPGDSIEIVWSDMSSSGATAYQVQQSRNPAFSTVSTSIWMPDTTFVFDDMNDGFTGFYHVRSRDDELNVSRWSCTVTTTQDVVQPESAVLPIVISYQGLPFEVGFSAEDTVSGVARVDLYYRYTDIGVYSLFGSSTDGSPIVFDIPDGLGDYYFYTVAEDSVGNLEDVPMVHDQMVTVTASPWILVSPDDGSGIGDDGNGRGTAWGDYNGDGDHDLYISNRIAYQSGADPTNHLFRNDGEDTGDPDGWLFPDVTTPALADDQYGQGVSWADFDGDGDLDLYMVNMQVNPDYDAPNHLYRNDGGGVFTDIGVETGVNDPGSGRSCSWRDFDQDGDVDLYLCNSGQNRLYRNDGEHPTIPGQWVFTNVAPLDGSGIGDDSYTMACAWADIDGDGDPDIYLSNFDDQPNRLLRNDGEDPENPGVWLWVDLAYDLGVDNSHSSTGCMWGDFDNDGRLDLFVCNDGPNALYHNISSIDPLLQGDVVYSTAANGKAANGLEFVDIAPLYDIGLDDGQYGAGVTWFDFDNDGDLDLYQGNHWNAQSDPAINYLFRNDGPDGMEPNGWLFTNVAPDNGLNISDDASTNGLSCTDFDDDGDLDLYLATMAGLNNKLFRNDVADSTDNHWLHVDMLTLDANTVGIGATLRCVTGEITRIREVDGGSGFLSQGSLTVEFGLGAATIVDSLEIRWPTGVRRLLLDVAVDQRLLITQISTGVEDPETPDLPLAFQVYPNYPNPFNPSTVIRFDLPHASHVNLSIYALDGSRVVTLVNEELPAGRQGAIWFGRDQQGARVASGLYFYRVQTPDRMETRRMMLVK